MLLQDQEQKGFYLLNVLPDGILARALADLSDICTAESLGVLGKSVQVNILSHRRLPEAGFEDLEPGLVIGQGDVDKLIKTPWPEQSRVNDVWPVGGTNDENSLLGIHAIHLSQQLVQHSVSSTSSITNAASPLKYTHKISVITKLQGATMYAQEHNQETIPE